jgi:predicted TPR repeat methyltransferase
MPLPAASDGCAPPRLCCRAWFAFSTEAGHSGDGFCLQPTGRYAHSMQHVSEAAAATGWQVVGVRRDVIRLNAGSPIHGHLCVLRRVTV